MRRPISTIQSLLNAVQLRLIAVVLNLILFSPAIAQRINAEKVNFPKEVNSYLVTSITQDKKGNMWFSTANQGLFSYDGYQSTWYKHNPQHPNSIASDRLEVVLVDHNGMIWAGTYGSGLNKLDPLTGIITHFTYQAGKPGTLINDTITTLTEDREGYLWIGTFQGISRMDLKTDSIINYVHSDRDINSLSCNQIQTIVEDKKGIIWVGTGSTFYENNRTGKGGLNRLDKKTGRVVRYMHDPKDPTSLADNRIRAIFEDSKGNLWIGSAGDGLHTLDQENGRLIRHRYDPTHPGKLSRPPLINTTGASDDCINMIKEDATGMIWIGSFNGINQYDPQTGQIKYYADMSDSTTGYRENMVWWAYSSADGLFWISTYGSGNVYLLNPYEKKISYYNLKESATSIYREKPGIFWIAGGKGLLRHDVISGKKERILSQPDNPLSLSSNYLSVLRADQDGKIWIGGNNGLDCFDPVSRNTIHYKHFQDNGKLALNDTVVTMHLSGNENLWLSYYGSDGLSHFNRRTKKFTDYHFVDTGENQPYYYISAILEDHQERIWVADYYSGIKLLNRQNGSVQSYLSAEISSNIFEDAKGVIWAGTSDSHLFRLIPGADNFTPFIYTDFEPPEHGVTQIYEDNENNLWIITTDEILRLNAERTESTRFGKDYGIHKSTSGFGDEGSGFGKDEFFYGDQTGYYVFRPDALKINPFPPHIIIKNFRAGNQLLDSLLDYSFSLTDSGNQPLQLRYAQNSFSLDIVPVHYADLNKTRVSFTLEPYENEWRISSGKQQAYYYRIPPGNYVLRFKATGITGKSIERSMTIVILAPWWRTWWAYSIYAGVFIVSLFFANRFLRNRILEKEKIRNREKEFAHAKEMERAYHELKVSQARLVQSEKMASLGELTAGIAHEIQNPLNFVTNFSELSNELLNEMDEEIKKGNLGEIKNISADVKQNLEKINHHGKRADAIVKGMLQHSRSSSGQKEPIDINTLTDEYLKLAFHSYKGKEKSFDAKLITSFDPEIGTVNLAPQEIGRVLLNIFNNAFYAVQEKKKKQGDDFEPVISVSTKKCGDKLEISVKDNGMGIPETFREKIFQPFFTTKPTGQGTGLGLSLSYDIVKSHNGEIRIMNTPGEGAEFIIILPLNV